MNETIITWKMSNINLANETNVNYGQTILQFLPGLVGVVAVSLVLEELRRFTSLALASAISLEKCSSCAFTTNIQKIMNKQGCYHQYYTGM